MLGAPKITDDAVPCLNIIRGIWGLVRKRDGNPSKDAVPRWTFLRVSLLQFLGRAGKHKQANYRPSIYDLSEVS